MDKTNRDKLKSKLKITNSTSGLLESIIDNKIDLELEFVQSLLLTDGYELLTLLATELTIGELVKTMFKNYGVSGNRITNAMKFKVCYGMLKGKYDNNIDTNIFNDGYKHFRNITLTEINKRLKYTVNKLEEGNILKIGNAGIKRENNKINLYDKERIVQLDVEINFLDINIIQSGKGSLINLSTLEYMGRDIEKGMSKVLHVTLINKTDNINISL